MSINLSRNSKLWVSTVQTGFTAENTWEIPLQDDFSFNQTATTTDVTVNEAGAAPIRGSKRFNDSLDPADWSFTTYTRPFIDANDTDNHTMVDIILWHALATGSAIDWVTGAVSKAADGVSVDFTDNSSHELAKLHLFFQVDNAYYHIEECQVNAVDLSLDIEGILSSAWSGQGTIVNTVEAADMPDNFTAIPDPASTTYIKNKLTTMSVTTNNGDAADGTAYNIPITGASLNITNNITYLTPSTLAEVDRPIGSFTGSFDVTGSFTAYLNDATNGSKDLFEYYQGFLKTTNSNAVVFNVGGPTGTRVEITLPTAQINIPDISIEDVVGVSVEFKGIPTDLDQGDEVALKFVGTYSQS